MRTTLMIIISCLLLMTVEGGWVRTAEAETVLYDIVGSTNDWAGSFEVTGLDSSPSDDSAIQSVDADGAEAFTVIYFGSNSAGYVLWAGDTEVFSLTSPEFYAVRTNSWNDILDLSFTLTVTNTFQGTATLTGSGGTITFSQSSLVFQDDFESGGTTFWSSTSGSR